jgi:hypothetical protein
MGGGLNQEFRSKPVKGKNIRNYQGIAVISAPVRDFYLVRFWSPRRSGVTLATTHKAGFLDPGGWHSVAKRELHRA